MSPLVTAEIVAGVLVLLAVSILAFIFIRRRMLAAGRPLMVAAVRHTGHGYRLGLLRFGGTRLQWFTLVGPSMRPQREWERVRLELEAPGSPHEVVAGMPDAVEVTCHYGPDTFQLALAPTHYTAVRSWLESAPPGFNVNVA
jgi:hypothetical protein